tara:strand:+ start:254 stop:805 length:552 start_codon:yes stop_codon:yes gene_type:complete
MVEDKSNGNAFPPEVGEVERDIIINLLGEWKPSLIDTGDKGFLEQGPGVLVIKAGALINAKRNLGVDCAWCQQELLLADTNLPISRAARKELMTRSIADDHAVIVAFPLKPPMILTLHRSKTRESLVKQEVDVRVTEAADNIDDVMGRIETGEQDPAAEFIESVDLGDMSPAALKAKRESPQE